MRCTYFALLAAVQVVSSVTLQLISPPDQNIGLYEAPASNRDPGKPRLNTIIIKSKPYNTSDTIRVQNDTSNSKWRRNLFVETENDGNGDDKGDTVAPALSCADEENCGESTPPPTFRPYSQEELNKFLDKYAELHGQQPGVDSDAAEEPSNKLANLYMENEAVNILEADKEKDKSKSASWQLVHSQTHNHPYDDRKGWVTLEPIPWSASQIQKWEPNPNSRPQIPSWDHKPDHHHHHSSQYDHKPQHFSTERPWNNPSYEYKPQRPNYNQHWAQHSKPHWQNENHPASHWGGHPDIITDDRPGSHFPSDNHGHRPPWRDEDDYDPNRPSQGSYYSHPEHPSKHSNKPNGGDGRWVLLSSTKGYSVPPRRHGHQRSLTFDTKIPDTMSSHRTVRLTVLPALSNTTNTTTSHGGLLEVESTFQTVDEAQREHANRMMKLETKEKNETNKPEALQSAKQGAVKVYTRNPASSRAAIIAAVGAGMIPATMAMLLPVMLGRKKRSAELAEEQDISRKENATNRIIHKQKLLFSDS